jgi:hypothetical protein
MRAPDWLITIALLLTSVVAAAQVTIPVQPVPPPPNSAVGDIKIDPPHEGQRIPHDFVTLKYELLNPGATAEVLPMYHLQLDANDPISTTSTSQAFTGLKPGMHTIMVELVDANGTPIPGSRKQVRFEVLPSQPGPSGATSTGQGGSVHVAAAAYQQPRTSASSDPENAKRDTPQSGDDDLPSSSTALPLLSVIGFGVLVGGIVSALKTRY